MNEPSALNLQYFLPYKLSRLVNDISAELSRTYAADYGLNVSQWRMLAAAAQLEPTSATELTDYSGMDKVTVSRSVADMVKRGLLTRTLDPRDNRRAIIALTPEGRDVYMHIAPAVVEIEHALLSVFDDAEQEQLQEFIDRLLSQVAVLRFSGSYNFDRRKQQSSRVSSLNKSPVKGRKTKG